MLRSLSFLKKPLSVFINLPAEHTTSKFNTSIAGTTIIVSGSLHRCTTVKCHNKKKYGYAKKQSLNILHHYVYFSNSTAKSA